MSVICINRAASVSERKRRQRVSASGRGPSQLGLRRCALQCAFLLLALPAAAATGDIVDRIVATVGQRMITLSDVKEAYRFECLLNRVPVQMLEGPRIREVAGRLIDQVLLEQEMESGRFPPAPPEDVEQRMAEIKKGFGDDQAFRRALEKYELDEARVRRRVELQARIIRFIEFRFRPGVQVDQAAIERYYRETLLPELRAKRVREIPGLEEVRERIEEVLLQERINEQFAAWMKGLRQNSAIQFR